MSLDLGSVGGILGLVVLIAGALILIRSSQRKQYQGDLENRVKQLEQEREELRVKVAALEEAARVLAADRAGVDAVRELTEVMNKFHEQNKEVLDQILKLLGNRRKTKK